MSVSFVIPVYNKAKYLPEVLAAVAAQKGDFAREYVFVDDGSTDNSLAVVCGLTQNWANVKIIEQKNSGSAKATNAGIFAATMEFIKFVDADDLLHERATEILLETIRANPDASIAYAKCHYFDDGEKMDLTSPITDYKTTRMDDPLYWAIRNSLFNPTQFIARTADVQSVGGCDERVVNSQEYALTMRLARLGPFIRVEETLAFLNRGDGPRHGSGNNRQLQRVSLSLALFIEDYPDTPKKLQHHAWRRAIGRAWKFAHRYRGKNFTSTLFWENLGSPVLPQNNYAAAIRRTLPAFD